MFTRIKTVLDDWGKEDAGIGFTEKMTMFTVVMFAYILVNFGLDVGREDWFMVCVWAFLAMLHVIQLLLYRRGLIIRHQILVRRQVLDDLLKIYEKSGNRETLN